MKIYNLYIIIFLFTTLLVSCSEKELKPAKRFEKIDLLTENKKSGFNPLKHGFNCDSLNIKFSTKNNLVDKVEVSLGSNNICTLSVLNNEIGELKSKDILITDFNFDGFCDFIIKDLASAQHGGINHYYFLFDLNKQTFKENNSLPKFIASFKLDIKNQRVKIYCPNDDCYAYYKYKDDGIFELVKGKYEIKP